MLIAAYSARCTVTALSGVGDSIVTARPGFVFESTSRWASAQIDPNAFVINRICRLIVKQKGMEVNVSSAGSPAARLG
jgi:hypothetical protein